MELPAVELRNITKTFGKAVANRDVSLAVKSGTIHGLVGENGAGKSTIMKVLFGLLTPDSGQILLDGEVKKWGSSRDASAAGIGMVHQHFMLSPVHSVLDNIILGVEPSGSLLQTRFLQRIDRSHARTELAVIMKMFDLPVPLDTPVGDLPVGIQQRIEILKVLYRKARVLILDEPTAVLTPQETEVFLLNLKKLKDEGKTIIVITHKLREILAIAEEITMMRQGSVVGRTAAAGLTETALAEMMVGRAVRLTVSPPPVKLSPTPVLSLQGVTLLRADRTKALDGFSFELHGGEILGIAGVEGNGQRELLALLSNPRTLAKRLVAGKAELPAAGGRAFKTLSNRDLRLLGTAFIPADRIHDGILPGRSVLYNFALAHHFRSPYRSKLGLRWGRLRQAAAKGIKAFDVRPPSLWPTASGLSGGNQQKLIFAREFYQEPTVVIAANPTRGVDVGSIEAIHDELVKARSKNCGILLVSSELSEVIALSDRVLVLFRGKVAGSFARGQADEKSIGILMGGGSLDSKENHQSSIPQEPVADATGHQPALKGPVVEEKL